jgi:hypothetical protein
VDRDARRRLRVRADARGDGVRARPELGDAHRPVHRLPGRVRLGLLRDPDRRLAKSIENFSYVTSIVITPLFLVAGTYFPISELPEWAQVAANLNPLYHCVQLVRDAVFGFKGWVDVYHVAVMAAFGVAAWRVAISRMERKLID